MHVCMHTCICAQVCICAGSMRTCTAKTWYVRHWRAICGVWVQCRQALVPGKAGGVHSASAA